MSNDSFGAVPEGTRWCPHCNGYGSSLKESSGRCTRCGGSGLVMVAAAGEQKANRRQSGGLGQPD